MGSHQHWIPQTLLRRFARPSEKRPRVYRVDVRTGKTIGPTNPRNFAGSRFYNRVTAGRRPDELETLFSKYETWMTEGLDQVEATDRLPTSDQLGYIVAAMALQALRTPLHERHALQRIDSVRRGNGESVPEAASAKETALAWALRLGQFEPTRNALAEKPWTLLVAPTSGPYLVCPDPPPYLMLLDEDALGSVCTDDLMRDEVAVVLPLSRRHLLVSSPRFDTGLLSLSSEGVSFYNMCAFCWAREYVFSPTAKPEVWDRDMMVLDQEGLHRPRTREA